MAIEQTVTIPVVETCVSDTYQVEVTVTDKLTRQTASAELSWSQAHDLLDELQARIGEATSAYWEDQEQRPVMIHGFDTFRCPECVAGKCGNCDGSAWDTVMDRPTTCGCDHGAVAA